MKITDIKTGSRVPLSEDPKMDELDEMLRAQETDRVESLLDMLEQGADEELTIIGQGEIDA